MVIEFSNCRSILRLVMGSCIFVYYCTKLPTVLPQIQNCTVIFEIIRKNIKILNIKTGQISIIIQQKFIHRSKNYGKTYSITMFMYHDRKFIIETSNIFFNLKQKYKSKIYTYFFVNKGIFPFKNYYYFHFSFAFNVSFNLPRFFPFKFIWNSVRQ